MTDMGRESSWNSDEAVEELLGKAAPRPVPAAEDARAVRDAVHAEWRQVTDRARNTKRLVSFAAAASILVAIFVSLNMLRIHGVEDVQVASIGKRFGSIYVLGENAELLEGNHLTSVIAGQTLITDEESGIGLEWGAGGSLRIDAKTRVEFVSGERIYLRSGRVYFDSDPALTGIAAITGSDAKLTIETDFGEVSHIGTQYMAEADAGRLTVSVREGEVRVERDGRASSAAENQQLAIVGSGAPSVVNFKAYGEAWQWTERTSPVAVLDGRSVSEFLGWVSQETGLELRYESVGAETYARQELLNGTLDTGPRQALQFWMLGTDLRWRIEDGVIYVDEM